MQEDADKPRAPGGPGGPGGNAWSRRDVGTAGETRPEATAEAEAAADPSAGIDGAVAEATDPAAELEELKDRLLRTLAEMENLRRRHARELDEARKFAMTGFARDLLDVADNMRRALAAVPGDARGGNELLRNLLEGVELTERTLLNAFERHGVKRVAPERGEKFDHNRHQAMFEMPTADLPPGHVAEVMQTGWVISDRLLRPAMVGVTKAVPQPAADADEAADRRGRTIDTNV